MASVGVAVVIVEMLKIPAKAEVEEVVTSPPSLLELWRSLRRARALFRFTIGGKRLL
jgi:hypothetical protein